MSNSQLNKLKSAIGNGTKLTLNLLSKAVGDSNKEAKFPHKLLLTNREVSRSRNTFANSSSANMKLAKTQLSKIVQSEWFLVRRQDNY